MREPVPANVGAWILRCNAVDVWDYFAHAKRLGIGTRTPYTNGWTVRDGSRATLLSQAGPRPMLLSVRSRSGTTICDVGVVTGHLYDDMIDSHELIDQSLAGQMLTFAEYTGVRLAKPVDRARFTQDSILHGSEYVRSQIHPVILSPKELKATVKYFHPADLRAAGWERFGLVEPKP